MVISYDEGRSYRVSKGDTVNTFSLVARHDTKRDRTPGLNDITTFRVTCTLTIQKRERDLSTDVRELIKQGTLPRATPVHGRQALELITITQTGHESSPRADKWFLELTTTDPDHTGRHSKNEARLRKIPKSMLDDFVRVLLQSWQANMIHVLPPNPPYKLRIT